MRTFGFLLVCVTLGGCPWIREQALSSASNLPAPSGCRPRDQRCNGPIPEVCSPSTRWITSLSATPSGGVRTCSGGCGLTVTDAGPVAHCLFDAGVDTSSEGVEQ